MRSLFCIDAIICDHLSTAWANCFYFCFVAPFILRAQIAWHFLRVNASLKAQREKGGAEATATPLPSSPAHPKTPPPTTNGEEEEEDEDDDDDGSIAEDEIINALRAHPSPPSYSEGGAFFEAMRERALDRPWPIDRERPARALPTRSASDAVVPRAADTTPRAERVGLRARGVTTTALAAVRRAREMTVTAPEFERRRAREETITEVEYSGYVADAAAARTARAPTMYHYEDGGLSSPVLHELYQRYQSR